MNDRPDQLLEYEEGDVTEVTAPAIPPSETVATPQPPPAAPVAPKPVDRRAPERKRTPREWLGFMFLVAFAGSLVLGVLGCLFVGADYYTTASSAREALGAHAVFRSGGSVGLWLGVVGTTLMTLMLLYSVRKSIGRAPLLGSPGWWLRFHIICGVMGPIYIMVHGGLQAPSGLIAVGFWCMVLVALSGAFGRYVFGHFPRTAAGRELDYERAQAELADLRAELVTQTASVGGEAIGRAVALARDIDQKAHTLPQLVLVDFELRRRKRQIRQTIGEAGLDPDTAKQTIRTLVGQLKLKRNLEVWQVSRRLFRYWHLFHAPLAQAMYLVIVVHIFNALAFGGALSTLSRPFQ